MYLFLILMKIVLLETAGQLATSGTGGVTSGTGSVTSGTCVTSGTGGVNQRSNKTQNVNILSLSNCI
jgi:hypothetical protein